MMKHNKMLSSLQSMNSMDETNVSISSHSYYTLIAKILSVKLGFNDLAGDGEDEVEEVRNVIVSLSVDGTLDGASQSHVTKSIHMQNFKSSSIPEHNYEFDLTGDIFKILMSIKLYQKIDPKQGDELANAQQMGSSFVDLSSVLQAGGEKIVLSRLTSHFINSNASQEIQLELKLLPKSSDFEFSYLEGNPLLKKAGYVFSLNGILSPSSFVQLKEFNVKRGLYITLQDLQYERKELFETRGFTSHRARSIDGARTYTVHKFKITESEGRRMLIASLDGLHDLESSITSVPHTGVQVVDAFLNRLEVMLVLDDGGGRYLHEILNVKGNVPEQHVSIILRQVLHALDYLHSRKMRIHNDIHPSNLLVLRSGEVRLSGFWFSSKTQTSQSQRFAGRYGYMAPERLLGLECGFASDVWSVGMLTLELLLGRPFFDTSELYDAKSIFEFKKHIVEENSPSLSRQEYSEGLCLFVDACLIKNIKLRATVPGLRSKEFITKYEALQNSFFGRWANRQQVLKYFEMKGS
mmetsp:Transcript_47324/g.147981  ORF Transcript_47324/g.147981 Transcript_47324/m.147981 type:complete len:522 (+) Transcript_47324:546-2111(+)